jgi:hypothetical protein
VGGRVVTTTAAPPVPNASRARGSGVPVGRFRRQWLMPAVIVALVIGAAVVIALLRPAPATSGYLDPASTGASGTHALADILAERGTQVERVTTAAAALATVGGGATTIVITSPYLLTGPQLSTLAATPADLLIVEPDPASLASLAPGVTVTGPLPIGAAEPGCRLSAAVLAGNADTGGTGLRLPAGTPGTACYHFGPVASLVQYQSAGHTITVLGTGAPLENQNLASVGNAALALNLLGGNTRLAWLLPQPTGAAPAPSGSKSLWDLVPLGAYLVAAELAIAVLLTALWRARRLGPLVTEQLPVVVRASETTQGHARLYQARRARDRAAAALRDAMLDRLKPALGLPAGANEEAITSALAARSTRPPAEIRQLLFASPPGNDADLVRLADDLDSLEGEVRAP